MQPKFSLQARMDASHIPSQYLGRWGPSYPSMSLADDPQFHSNGSGRVAHLVYRLLKFPFADVEMLCPILDFPHFLHVDLATVRLVFLGQIVRSFSSRKHGPGL